MEQPPFPPQPPQGPPPQPAGGPYPPVAGPPQYQPPSYTAVSPQPGVTYMPPPPPIDASAPKTSRGARIALLTGIVALFGVAATAVIAVRGDTGGNSPEVAVRAFADAISREDIVGAAKMMPPGEIGSAPDLYDLIIKVLRKNESFEGSGGPLEGVDLEFRDLALETENLADRVSKVRLVGGEVKVDVETAAMQPIFREEAGEDIHDVVTIERINKEIDKWNDDRADDRSANEDSFLSGLIPPGELSGLYLMTTKVDGRWYVSYQYTVLEIARELYEAPLPQFTAIKPGKGADSAEGVLGEISKYLNGLDAAKFRETQADPNSALARGPQIYDVDEIQAFLDYMPAFTKLAESWSGMSLDKGDPDNPLEGVEFNLSTKFTTKQSSLSADRTKVTVTGGTIDLEGGREAERGDRAEGRATLEIYDGMCARGDVTTAYDGESDNNSFDECADPVFEHIDFDGFFYVAVKHDGRWYFSMVETIVEYARLALENELAK